MKSSVRILAIALALAFLLLARTAFQEASSASADAIKLDDGEASFADLLDGTQEAEYLGFNMGNDEDGKFSYVYFYINSDDLGTQMTASIMASGTPEVDQTRDVDGTAVSVALSQLTADPELVTLGGGNVATGTIPAVSAMLANIDVAYCSGTSGITATTTETGIPASTRTEAETIDHTYAVPANWGLEAVDGNVDTSDGRVATCSAITAFAGTENRGTSGVSTTSDETRTMLAGEVRAQIAQDAADRRDSANRAYYVYGSGQDAYSEVHPDLRYTNDDDPMTVGGTLRPLASVKATNHPSGGGASTDYLTFITNPANGEFRAFSLVDVPAADALSVEFTYDVQDIYAADEDENMPHDGYSSGYGRAYVSSGSDSGMWVTITEVADETMNVAGDASATSNLFQGVVKIVNDTSLEDGTVIYAQDGDTLTLQVFDENGDRSSDVLASATAIIDNSAPTIRDLSPADESVLSDDTLQISFNVNDEGSGLDFRAVDEKKVVLKVEASDGTNTCDLTEKVDDIDNAGGNASRVGVLVSPSGSDAKFSARCGNVIDPDLGPDAPGGNGNTHGNKFDLIITSQDLAGNMAEHTTQLTIDTENPSVKGNPEAGNGWDEDKNKSKPSQDSILIQFNESLDVDTVSASDFSVTGYSIDSVEVVGTNDDDNKNLNEYVVLTLTEDLSKNARPSVSVSGVTDVAGNAIQATTRTSDNVISAAITVVPFSALLAKDGEQAISFTSDEALRATSRDYNTQFSVNGNTSGLAIKVADDTMGGSGTFKQKTFDGSGAYGVMLRAVDVDGNKTDVGAVKVSREDVSDDIPDAGFGAAESIVVTPANWPPADTNFDGDLKDEFKLYVAGADDATHSEATDVNVTTGKVTFASAGSMIASNGRIEIDYSYVNSDQVIQVDVDEPTLTSIPADNAETDYAGGAIQFIWSDDDGYAGDSYKTVTLSSATHEAGGTTTDILGKLTSNDSKRWVLTPAEDLALGEHEFTLTASDAAGNSATETITITIVERKPVKVSLSPGWNLISFRGTPASTDVNAIFGDATVSTVSQYDGRRVSPWTVWSRDADGNFMSSPAGRMNIDPGLGLYVNSTDGAALEVDIPGASRDSLDQIPPSTELIPGWNLVAVLILNPDTKSVAVDDYLPEGTWTRAFKLDNITGRLQSISPKAEDGDDGATVDSGQALWVFATKAAVVTPSE